MATDEQILRLPKWAQDEIRVCRMRVAEAEEELKKFGEQKPTGIVMSDSLRKFHIPTNYRFRHFVSDDLDHHSLWIEAYSKNGGLHITGGSQLEIIPVVSNSIEVRLVRNRCPLS